MNEKVNVMVWVVVWMDQTVPPMPAGLARAGTASLASWRSQTNKV
ncbi:hypothetical protein [Aquamicrobium sp. NLF2-7]|nr:hypothetical protein [Aquamicrobium sp. NLF2-7]